MKVLFLDIDGVLNSHQSMHFWHNKRDQEKWENELYKSWQGTLYEYLAQEFCPIAISNLEQVMRKVPDLKIVVSSTWRKGNDVQALKEIFMPFKLISNVIIDRTPVDPDRGPRGLEIQQWLDEQKNHGKVNEQVEKFVIVDDDGDMEHLKVNLVQTDGKVGLDWNKAQEIIRRFNEKAN